MAQRTLARPAEQDRSLSASIRTSRASASPYIPLLSIVYGAGLALFLAIEPTEPWILLAIVALVALGTDGILRSHPHAGIRGITDTAPFLFVPVLLALAAGLFLEEVVTGYWAVPAVAAASVLMATAVYAEYSSAVSESETYPIARFLLNLLTYLAAFAFYSVVYDFDIDLLAGSFAIGLFSFLLAIEIFREAEADVYRALMFAAVIGLVVAEMRWALYFIPLEGFLAAILLLLVFYLTTGLIQHLLTGDLNRSVMFEFALVTALGIAVVVAGNTLSLG
jgi:Protein of unknown function (DUF5656)